jgi:adenylate kinase
MSLEIIFGINASGKDTIAKKLKKIDNEIQITSESRLLMYHLGYISSFYFENPINKEDYKKLENTSQEKIKQITKTSYKQTLENFRDSNIRYVLLSHLVFALALDKNKPIYLTDRDVPSWYNKVGNNFIQIICNAEEILRRRIKDKNNNTRDRGNIDSFVEITKHQNLCNIKWEKFVKNLPKNSYIIIENNNLKRAVNMINKFINK